MSGTLSHVVASSACWQQKQSRQGCRRYADSGCVGHQAVELSFEGQHPSYIRKTKNCTFQLHASFRDTQYRQARLGATAPTVPDTPCLINQGLDKQLVHREQSKYPVSIEQQFDLANGC